MKEPKNNIRLVTWFVMGYLLAVLLINNTLKQTQSRDFLNAGANIHIHIGVDPTPIPPIPPPELVMNE